MKLLPKAVLAIYLCALVWLVMFKFSADIAGVFDYHRRSLNLIPFAGLTRTNFSEMVANIIVFIPFGLLLSVAYKQLSFRRKLAIVCASSVAAEILQYIFAIGATDINDVIANTSGGLLGLALYHWGHKFFGHKQDAWVMTATMVLLTWVILLRLFVLRVRY